MLNINNHADMKALHSFEEEMRWKEVNKMKYLKQEADNLIQKLDNMNMQLNEAIKKLEWIRDSIIIPKALEEGWTKEEIEIKLQKIESEVI